VPVGGSGEMDNLTKSQDYSKGTRNDRGTPKARQA